MGARGQVQTAWKEVTAGTADLFLQQTFSFSKTFACISALQRLIQMNETRPGKSFVSYCNQLVGLFQVSRQQTGLVQRLSGVLWFLRVYEEDGETASIALYDFIWHCQQRLLNRPLQLVVVFRWENPNNDQVVQILPSLSHILALKGFVWQYLPSVTKNSFGKETSAVHWFSCFGGNCNWATQEEFKYFLIDVKTKIFHHFWVNVSIVDHDDEKGKDAKNKEKWQQWLQLSSSDQWWCWRWWWWWWWRWALQQLQLAQVVHFLTSALSHTWGYPPHSHRLLRGRPSNQNPIKTFLFFLGASSFSMLLVLFITSQGLACVSVISMLSKNIYSFHLDKKGTSWTSLKLPSQKDKGLLYSLKSSQLCHSSIVKKI